MTATATETKLVERGVVWRKAQYNGCPPYGQAPVGALIPWASNLERLANLGYVGRVEVDEATLKDCPHCEGLQFRDDKLLAEHVAQDQKRIISLKATIPHLEESAKRRDLEAENMMPMPFQPTFSFQRDKQRIANSAQSARDDAAKFKRELASLTGEQE